VRSLQSYHERVRAETATLPKLASR